MAGERPSRFRALVLDFDGLILDTETSQFESWRRTFEAHGHELPRERWLAGVGLVGGSFDPLALLAERMGAGFVRERVQAERRALRDEIVHALAPRDGVHAWIEDAGRHGLRLGIASSSPLSWVGGHLGRLGLVERFHAITTREDAERLKPHPDLYHAAARKLGVAAEEIVAVEDSPHGAAAARAAGCFTVAVPNPMTEALAFPDAHLRLGSLAERTLAAVLAGA